MKLKRLLKNIICAMVIAEILTITVAIVKNNNTQELAQGKQTMLAESTVIEFNEGVGENLTAKLNTETGELRITGTGEMTTNWDWNAVPWYSYRKEIKTVVIEKGVTSIGRGAFSYCSSLSEINIPEGVTSIGYRAFDGCSRLSKIEIPSSVTRIGNYAFDGCSSLSEINVQEENKNYSSVNGVLFNKEKTRIIKYPEGKKETIYNIPEGVTSIGSSAFFKCSSLSEINIPEGVTSIGDVAFEYCRSLSKIEIPSNVTSIGSSAFYGCELNITIELSTEETQEIELPSIIKRAQIKEDILYTDKEFTLKNCTLNESKDKLIVNTKEVKTNMASLYIESGALKGLKLNIIPKEIEYVEGVGENLTAKLNTETGELRITGTGEMTNWSTETKIPWCSYREKIKTVVIEKGVTSIGSYAFKECRSLSEIEIPSSVTSIGSSAFSGCSSLSEINVQEENKNYSSVKGILFNKEKSEIIKYPAGKKETSYNIPEGVTSIGRGAFSYCSSLSKIEIPSSVTSIGSSAFFYCSSLNEINIPEGVTSIGDSAFYGCSSLSEINIPEGVTSIGSSAFKDCSSLSKIEIPNGVTSIGDVAFEYCSSLSEIKIPEGVTSIGRDAFGYCRSLSKIEIPSSVTSIGSDAFGRCSSLSEINIPEGVTSIGRGAFSYCRSLSKIEIPSSVTSIGSRAFEYCSSLKEINIPEGVTSVGEYAFNECNNLIIHCRSNSYAKEYAVNNNINYTEINPEITSVTGNAEEWTHENVTLKVEAKDTMYGLAEEAYSFDGGTTWQKENTKTYSQNTEGIVIKVKAKDGAIATYGETINITKITKEHIAIGEFIIDKEAKCEEPGSKYKHCIVKGCNEKTEITEIPAKGHTEVIDKKVEPKCTQTGLTEGKHCSVCNAVIVAQTEIPAKGHTEIIDKKVEPKCTEAGLTEGKHCSVCNAVIIAQTEIPAKGHTEVIDKKVEPKCTEAGLTEGKHCSVCNAVIVAQTEIPAKGHTEEIDKKVEPKCTQTGLTEGKHCSVCNAVIIAQKEIPALGHNYKDGICTMCGEKETIFINTSTYKIENEKYIRNVKLNTTIEEFKKSIKEEYTVKITKDEKNVTIGTGAKVTVSKNGENIGEYIVVVTGDLTGDGKLQNGDLIKLVRHKVELITLEEPYKLAGDINGDGKISDSDIIKLARVLVSIDQL